MTARKNAEFLMEEVRVGRCPCGCGEKIPHGKLYATNKCQKRIGRSGLIGKNLRPRRTKKIEISITDEISIWK